MPPALLVAERPVPIRIDHAAGTLMVDGRPHSVRPRALAVLHFVLRCNEKDLVPPDQATAAEAFCKRLAGNPHEFGPVAFPDLGAEDFRRELNHLRELLRHEAWQPALRTLRQRPFTLEVG